MRPFLKGKKGFGSRSNPSTISHVMEGPSVISKEGEFQTNPFQALRGQFDESTLEDLREAAALEGGVTAGIEKEGEKETMTESSQSISGTSRLEAYLVDLGFLNRFETSTPTVVNSSSLSIFG